MKKVFYVATALLLGAIPMHGQRVMDKLDRGVIAVKADQGNMVSWRVLGEDADNVKFNVYRDGSKLNSQPLTVSNYVDASGSASSKYIVKTVVDGVEKETSKAGINFGKDYLEIKVAPVPSNADGSDISSHYEPNDATVADLDGDGEMEILIKLRNNTFHGNGYPMNSTDFDIIQVYKLDGKLMWWIDCGRNMVDFQSNEINIAAYDWDLDGKAECVMRAADGTTIHMADGNKYVVGDPNVNTLGDVQGSGMAEKFTHSGAEYLLYLNGETGKPYVDMTYPLARLEPTENDLAAAWGDGYGHRSSKHFFGAPYLDGRKPSIFLARGIYTRHKMVAYDVDPSTHRLVERWRWVNNTPGSPWYGQGYHNYSVADVDWDGRDEIVFGSMVIDDNGRGLSTTGLGHGDSHHVGDLNPYIYGQEIAACNEDRPNNNYRDATTSKIYYRTTATSDDGRAIAGNFSNDYPGAQFITSHDSETLISCVTNAHIPGATGTNNVAQNFRIYWDGDLLDETFNYANGRNTAGTIYKYRQGAIKTFTGTMTNNDTKGTPCFQGDILGDWREEIILRSDDNKSFRIYSTNIPTEHRIYTLLHDPQYRNAMVWQMNGYNQTPHPSFFLGELEGITVAPPAPTMNNRTELTANGSISSSTNGKDVVFAHVGDATASIGSGATPALFVDNAPTWVQGNDNNDNITYTTYTHTLGGSFGGTTKVVKLGGGKLVLTGSAQNHSGATEVWYGTLATNGAMPNSHVWLNRHTKLESDGGNFGKGVEMFYGAELHVGSADKAGIVTINDLNLGFGSRVCLDLFADGLKADALNTSNITVEKKTWKNGPQYSTPVFAFTPHYAAGETTLPGGEYILGTAGKVTGNLADIVIEGLNGQPATLAVKDGKLVLNVISQSRAATEIVWAGTNGNTWDNGLTNNFTIRATGEPTTFVSGDKVIFDDSAAGGEINLPTAIYPGEVIFNNSEKTYTITGAGFEGNVNIEKRGTGRAIIKSTSNFTGKITINNGTLEVAGLGANEGSATGSLGHYTNAITINGGGMLATNYTGKMSHPITVTEGGIEVMGTTTLTLAGVGVTGGTFIKGGSGQINFGAANSLEVCRIDEGKIYDEGDTHSIAQTVVFNGTKVEYNMNNSCYSNSENRTNFDVPEGKSGKLTLDGRCNYRGKLTGKGDLEVFAPWVRNYLYGDWSAFEGTLTVSQETNKNNTVNKYGSDFTYSGSSLPKATLNITSGAAFNCNAGGKFQIGNITGQGTLGGSGNFYVGGNGQDAIFSGTFAAIGLFKEGSGRLSVVKEQPNIIATYVNEGELMIKGANVNISMTGSSPMTVKSTLSGNGTVNNSKVTFGAGSVLNPTHTSKAHKTERRTIRFTGEVAMDPASALAFEIVAAEKYSKIVCEGNTTLTKNATVTLNGYTPKLGDEFIFWEAPNNTVKPDVQFPELPAGFGWDTSKVTAAEGRVIVSDHTGIDDIAADTEVRCLIVSIDGIVLVDTVTNAGNVDALCRDLGAGTYVVRLTGDNFEKTDKVIIR